MNKCDYYLSDQEVDCYRFNYKDLRNETDLQNHWKTKGCKENRSFRCSLLYEQCSHPLTDREARCYLTNYEDLRNNFKNNLSKVKEHWQIYGCREKRNFNCFLESDNICNYTLTDKEASCYYSNYQDIGKQIDKKDTNKIKEHWKNIGCKEKRKYKCKEKKKLEDYSSSTSWFFI